MLHAVAQFCRAIKRPTAILSSLQPPISPIFFPLLSMGEKKGNAITSKVAIPAGGEKRERRHKRKAEENETGRKTGRKVLPQNDLKSFYKKNN